MAFVPPVRNRAWSAANSSTSPVEELSVSSLVVEEDVLNGHPRLRRQHHGDALVALGELGSSLLLAEVEAAEDAAAHDDGSPQEGMHDRVVRGEPAGAWVLGDLLQAEGMGLLQHDAQHTLAGRQPADSSGGLLVDPRIDKTGQLTPRTDDADRPVGRPDHLPGQIRDAGQEGVEMRLRREGDPRLDEGLEP